MAEWFLGMCSVVGAAGWQCHLHKGGGGAHSATGSVRRSGSAACIKGMRGCEVQCYRWRQGGSVTCIEGVVVGCGVALRGRGKCWRTWRQDGYG